MEVIYERCCGLDIHKKSVVACLLISSSAGEPERSTQTFGTMTQDLLALSDWLAEHRVTQVAMESTGVYWKPAWNLLEGNFELLLVNPRHIKAVPGRKTDVNDAEWIAELLRHGLLKGADEVPDFAGEGAHRGGEPATEDALWARISSSRQLLQTSSASRGGRCSRR